MLHFVMGNKVREYNIGVGLDSMLNLFSKVKG